MISAGALLHRMRLFSSAEVIAAGEHVLVKAVELSLGPNLTLNSLTEKMGREAMQPLQAFAEACRRELDKIM